MREEEEDRAFHLGSHKCHRGLSLTRAFSLNILVYTSFFLSSLQRFYALFNFFLLWNVFCKPLSSSLWNIFDAQSPEGIKKSPHLVLFGEHWSILSCLKFPLRLYCEDRAVWAKLMGEGSKRDDKYKVLHQPATHSQCGIGREKKIGIMEKSWTGLVEWE